MFRITIASILRNKIGYFAFVGWLATAILPGPAEALDESHGPLAINTEHIEDYSDVLSSIRRRCSPVYAIQFSPNGQELAVATRCGLTLWDPQRRRPLRLLTNVNYGGVIGLAYSPDGKTLAFLSGQVYLWDHRQDGEPKALTSNRVNYSPAAIAFHPNSRLLAVTNYSAGKHSVELWDIQIKQQIGHFDVPSSMALGGATSLLGGALSLAFSPDGRRLLAGLGEGAILWELESKQVIQRWSEEQLPSVWLYTVGFEPQSTRLALGQYLLDPSVPLPKWSGTRYDIDLGPLHFSDPLGESDMTRLVARARGLGFMSGEGNLAFSPNGGHAAHWVLPPGASSWSSIDDLSAAHRALHIIDLKTKAVFRILNGDAGQKVATAAFDPSGRLVAGGFQNGSVSLWDVVSGEAIAHLGGERTEARALALSTDGHLLASMQEDGTVRLWNAQEGLELHRFTDLQESYRGNLGTLTFAAENRLLIAITNTRIALWDLNTGERPRIIQFPKYTPIWPSVGFEPKTQLLAIRNREGVLLWNIETGKLIRRLNLETKLSSITTDWGPLAFSPDGQTLAVGAFDPSVRLFDVATGAEICRLPGHQEPISSIAFGKAGKSLITAAKGDVKIWDPATCREHRQIKLPQALHGKLAKADQIIIEASGSSLLTEQGGMLSRWRLDPPQEGTMIWELETAPLELIAHSRDMSKMAMVSHRDGVVQVVDNVTGDRGWAFVGGQSERWVACRSGECRRYDDGRLLMRSDPKGRLSSVPPADGGLTKVDLQVIEAPSTLSLVDGSSASFQIRIRNQGEGRVYWLRAYQEPAPADNTTPLVLIPAPVHAVLEPGEEALLSLKVSAWTQNQSFDAKKKFPFQLRLEHAYGELTLSPISVEVTAP